MIACENSEQRVSDDFPDFRKIVKGGAALRGKQTVKVTHITRENAQMSCRSDEVEG